MDIHDCVEEDPIVAAIHNRAEKFDPRAEVVFSYLQARTVLSLLRNYSHAAEFFRPRMLLRA